MSFRLQGSKGARLKQKGHRAATCGSSNACEIACRSKKSGKTGEMRRLHRSRAAEVAARFLAASDDRRTLARALARTVAATQTVEQRLKEMQLLQQKLEEQNQRLRMIVALHRNILVHGQHESCGGLQKASAVVSPSSS